MGPKLTRSEPPYLQIARHIRSEIESGALTDGDTVPSAREIAASWGVALATATKVHGRLRSDGLVRAVPGVGTVVASNQTTFGGAQRLTASEHGRVYGVDERAKIRSSEIVAAPGDVAEALGLKSGAPVVRRERVTLRGESAVSMSVSWFDGDHVSVAPKLVNGERMPEGTFTYLAAALRTRVVSGREQVEAGGATAEEANALGIEPDAPVLRSRTWFYTEAGEVIEYGQAAHPSGRRLSHDFALA